MRSLHIFRRDLRLDDNNALIEASELSDEIVACFIFDPRQATAKNEFFCANAFQFMLESLDDLGTEISRRGGRLYFFEGEAHQVVSSLIEEEGIEAVFFNRDYTPFSKSRDETIRQVCSHKDVRVSSFDDALLTSPGDVCTNDGSPYQIYSYFAKKAKRSEPPHPRPLTKNLFYGGPIEGSLTRELLSDKLEKRNRRIHVRGGRTRGIEILDSIDRFGDYDETRDRPSVEDGTTSLSAYHKFGCISARETYWEIANTFDAGHTLIGELYWRDFFTLLAEAHPRVFGESFHSEYDSIRWKNRDEDFDAWRKGRTGFPIVDAGMRQLAETGWMHNRVRMIVASFLVKDLQIDWRWGEKHFAKYLVDYDPAVNNGNWQWAASTGADAQPYFRIFNPWTQGKRFDPEAAYIRRWVPELESLDPKQIHSLDKKRPEGLDYPEPIVDHRSAADRAQRMFEKAKKESRKS